MDGRELRARRQVPAASALYDQRPRPSRGRPSDGGGRGGRRTGGGAARVLNERREPRAYFTSIETTSRTSRPPTRPPGMTKRRKSRGAERRAAANHTNVTGGGRTPAHIRRWSNAHGVQHRRARAHAFPTIGDVRLSHPAPYAAHGSARPHGPARYRRANGRGLSHRRSEEHTSE